MEESDILVAMRHFLAAYVEEGMEEDVVKGSVYDAAELGKVIDARIESLQADGIYAESF